RRMMVVRFRVVICVAGGVIVRNGAHPGSYLPRAARIADGWIAWPERLPQALRVYVITAAMSVLESCFHDGIAVFTLPCSTISICASAGPFTIFEPSSAGNVLGTPLPLAWWHATQ